MYYLFLDESGDHNLIKINKDYPVFVLAGCIVESNYYHSTFIKEIQEYKTKLFNTNKIILHTADIVRNKNGFEKLRDAYFRRNFYKMTNDLIKKLDFTLIACIVDKRKYSEKYKELAFDPYELALKFMLERFYYFLKDYNNNTKIYAESRGNYLDGKLGLAYSHIKYSGIISPTKKIKGQEIRKKFLNF